MDPWDELFKDHLKVTGRDVQASARSLAAFNQRLVSEQMKQRRNRVFYAFSAAVACFALLGGGLLYQQQNAPLPHTVAYEAYSQVNGQW
ncbi:hypothetical protein [Deinococcus cellulosilyticus]|uniref:Uncharacterized protein n=1 Tax=Deinococcus cellulosilyticus (strain DSM 18568 / NBRC 106333 / KACC 11606 / 5516J-15) TaxID=1223518 RepID=A0A511N6E4_DEIC1|nr:hypothetical protein [Deinococcus cellulosilyticus]GEM48028.1 hypothetical protein DC3_36630 [Deinococcus cellulosilyticus NBRC 106333 = KACC 11606]